jgi:GTP-binding protein EngB required for normal cell division
MSKKGLSVAVVGHANAGKTSLMRTLLRDPEFGEVADQAGTTRHVEGGALLMDDSNSLALFDTPGLEDSMRLHHILNGYFTKQSVDGVERLQHFLAHQSEYPELEQEAKVLRTLLSNDLIFYVVDLREPILGKYRDELQILSYAAKPVIPVLNFTQAGAANLEQWKTQLARLNFHAFVSFDNVHFKFIDEIKIYQKMQTLLADKEELLQAFINQRRIQWSERFNAASVIVANLFVESACVRYKAVNTEQQIEQATLKLKQAVRNAESKCVRRLLRLYQFRKEDVEKSELPVEQDGWQLDLFSADNLQEFGIKLTGNIAKGAGVGVAVDLVTAGMTLGVAAVTGGVAGALWGVKQRYYDEIQAKIKGCRYICLNDTTLQVLWLRQIKLLALLQQRGHASVDKIDYQVSQDKQKNELPKNWSKWLRKSRNHPDWSSLNENGADIEDSKRLLFIEQVSAEMVNQLGDL